MSQDNDKTVPLAIIGIGCMFPGAEDSTRYWSNIKHGRDKITDIPESHWDIKDYFDKDPKRPDFTYAKTGGFLEPFDFNPLDYGIPPNAIEATDTAQLLGLVAAQQALIDAGYDPKENWDKSRVSVVLGVTGALELVIPLGARLGHPKWRRALEEAGVDAETANDVIERISDSYVGWQEASFPGLLGNVVAGRIANRLDLGGTNCVVDAACASSLSALHLASLELISGRSSMAIAGGVDTFNDIFMYMCFSKTPALSPTGHSRPFDAQGDGTILGEGVGMVVLKRLEDAKKDGDRIYAILKGVGSSSDGKGQAIYAPSSEGQARALRNAYEVSGISPNTVELVEAHGTGTKVGDNVELTALSEVYGSQAEDKTGRKARWCAIGSVKSQIGHTKAAAGVAGLIKASLALHNKVLPPSIKVSAPLPALGKDNTPFYLNTLPRPWLGNSEHPRRAALSALGFGGSNFHCVLEESASENQSVAWTGDFQILAFSGPTRSAVSASLADAPKKASVGQLRIFAAESRRRFKRSDPIRLLLPFEVSDSGLEAVLGKGLALLGAKSGEGLHTTPDGVVLADHAKAGEVAVLFPGQGSQYVGMLRDLSCQFPEMLDTLNEAEEVFQEGSHSAYLSDLIYPRWTFTDKEAKAKQGRALTDTAVAQPAIGATSLGAYRILQGFGLTSSLFGGHSYGELTALCAGQRLSTKDFHRLSRLRGELMASGEGDRGSMLAVKADVETVEAFLKESNYDLVLANKNSPTQCVLSGASADVKAAVKALKAKKIRCTELSVAAAFHSSFVSDAAKPLGEALGSVEIGKGQGQVFANSTGQPYSDSADELKSILANQLAKPVEFVKQIQGMYDAGARVFLEVGPGNRLTGLTKSILGEQSHFARALDSSGGRHHSVLDLAKTIAWLSALGLEVDLQKWDDGETVLAKAPKAKKKALMSVALTGSNYRSPYEKKAPKAPKPKVTAPVQTQPAPPRPTPQLTAASTNGQARRSQSALPKLKNKPVTPRKQDVTAMTIPSGHSHQLSEALRITQENIAALQRIQEQNAQLHERFMEGQENAQQTFHMLFQQQQQLLLGSLGQGSASIPVAAPIQTQPALPRRNGTSAPKVTPAAPRVAAPTPAPAPKPVAPAPKPAPVAPKPAPAAGASQSKISALLLAVVAEKTGYPAEMLELDMGLDSDLGIDSIKRVEILSSLQEQLPEIPSIKSDEMGSIQTLKDIVEILASAAPAKAVAPERNGRAPSAPAKTTNSGQISALLLAVVAEKTGYPAEMLELDMGLDSDLGIDSIKRVEILSSLQEQLPEIPSIKSDEMGSIQTLKDIVELLASAAPSESAAPAPSSSSSVDGEQISALLLAVVAEKTGYPAEMLELDMGLDSDLGIDSIKRVEILSALQEQMPEAPTIKSDEMGSIQTLRDIVDLLGEVAGAMASGAGSQEEELVESLPQKKNDPRDSLDRFELGMELFPSSDRAPVMVNPGLVYITDDGTDLPEIVARGFEEKGLETQIGPVKGAPDFSNLVGLVLLSPKGSLPASLPFAHLELTQKASKALRRGGSFFVSVSRMDGAFGLKSWSENQCPYSATLGALVKTADKEWKKVACKSLDLASDSNNVERAARAIVDEALLVGPLEVGLGRGDERRTPVLRSAPIGPELSGTALHSDDILLVTGGARGVTAATAIALAEASEDGATFVLIGRSPAPEEEEAWLSMLSTDAEIKKALMERGERSPKVIQEKCRRILADREIRNSVSAIKRAGMRVEYASVDARDKDAVRQFVDRICRDYGEPTGLIHGAGVLADRLIEDKTADQFDRVFGTKVHGFENFMDALQGLPLRHLVLFSSSTGRLGRKGQVDYAMANEALNKYAQKLNARSHHLKALALNWGPWAGGMVTPNLRKVFEKEGVALIPEDAGAEFMVREMVSVESRSVEQVILGTGSKVETPRPQAKPLSLAFERELEVSTHSFLKSHVLDGRAVLPMAVIIEWLAHGALHGQPGLAFAGFEDMRVLKGLVIDENEKVKLQVLVGKAVKDGKDFLVNAELRSARGENEILHARAVIRLAASLPKHKASEALSVSGQPYALSKSEIYENVLFHGPDFQSIESVAATSREGMIAQVQSAPAPKEWLESPLRGTWISDPLALDSAFQLMILWSVEYHEAPSLPCAIGRYRQFKRSFPKTGVELRIAITRESSHQAKANIEFLDSRGQVVARMDDFECVMDASLKKAFRLKQLVSEQQSGEHLS